MRTKTLLLTAAVTLAGIATSMAQVYSQNIVGYVNVALKPGFNLIANQLNATGGNTINTILTNVPDSTQLLKWKSTGSYADAETFVTGVGWIDGLGNTSTTTLNPGEAVFLNLPSAANVTLVGEVSLATNTVALTSGFSLASIATPQSLPLTYTAVKFPTADSDQVLFWDATNQKFKDAFTFVEGAGWFDALGGNTEPTPAVGEGFFVNKLTATNWVRAFVP